MVIFPQISKVTRDMQTEREDPSQVPSGLRSLINGGKNNRVTGKDSQVWSGEGHIITGDRSVIRNGNNNRITNVDGCIVSNKNNWITPGGMSSLNVYIFFCNYICQE